MTYFTNKLNDVKKYSIHNLEFYALVQTLRKWRHYFLPKEFVVHTDNYDLQFINNQHKLNQRHEKWVDYLQSFKFVLKHKSGKTNEVDALGRRIILLHVIQANIVGFDSLKGLYVDDINYKDAFEACNSPISKHRRLWMDLGYIRWIYAIGRFYIQRK